MNGQGTGNTTAKGRVMAKDGDTGGAMGGGPGEGGGGKPGGGDGPGEPVVSPAKRAVCEDELWQERAQAAEARAMEFEERASMLEAELAAAVEEASAALELAGVEHRRGEIERRLRDAGVVDAPTAMLLIDIENAGEDSPDADAAVRALHESKPYLFRRSGGERARPSAMSASAGGRAGVDLGSLAEEARESGDRTALLRYLRGRRAV